MLADFRRLLLVDGEAAASRQLKLLHDGIYLAISSLQDRVGLPFERLPLQIIGRIRPLVTNDQQKQRELLLLGVLVDECEKWFRSYQPVFPLTFQLVSPGGALQTTLDAGGIVGSVAVMADGRVISGSIDKTVRVWDYRQGSVCGYCRDILNGLDLWLCYRAAG